MKLLLTGRPWPHKSFCMSSPAGTSGCRPKGSFQHHDSLVFDDAFPLMARNCLGLLSETFGILILTSNHIRLEWQTVVVSADVFASTGENGKRMVVLLSRAKVIPRKCGCC